MRRLMLTTLTLGALMASGLASIATADDNATSPAPPLRIALIDLSNVFERCDSFTQGKAELEEDLAEYQAKFQLQKLSVEEVNTELEKARSGSPEHFELQKKVARMTLELKAQLARSKEKLLAREAELYAEVYRRVKLAVEKYCKQNGIQLVLRHELEPIDTLDRKKLIQNLNRLVVFQLDLDITEKIVSIVNGDTT